MVYSRSPILGEVRQPQRDKQYDKGKKNEAQVENFVLLGRQLALQLLDSARVASDQCGYVIFASVYLAALIYVLLA